MFVRLLALLLLVTVSTGLHAQEPKKKLEFPGKPSSGGAADAARKIIDANASRLEAAKRLQEQRSAGATTNLNNAAKAGITPRNDMEFPAAWKQIVENRAKLAVVGLTKKEKELLKALDTPLIVNFNKTRFRDAIDFFADKSGYPIAIHADSLVEVMASADDPVTYKTTKPLPMRTLLRKIVREVGLTYVLKDETLQVMTPERAREMLVIKTYPAGDVVADPKDPNNTALKFIHAQRLIRIIHAMIEPLSWDVNGGPGSIVYEPNGETFVVRASAEIHLMMRANGFSR